MNVSIKFERKIEMMLQAVIEDLIKGEEQGKAGYRTPDTFDISQSEERELLEAGILEKDSEGGVRFNFTNTRIRKQLKSFDIQLKQLDYFLKNTDAVKSDLKRLKNASKILSKISEALESSPENWSIVIAIGWYKMLESSSMPGMIDRILEEGFSPKDWMIKAMSSSSKLAMEVAMKFGQIANFKEEKETFLAKIGISSCRENSTSLEVESDTVEKIKKVLRWTESLEELTQEIIKMLGFFWFSIFILELANLMPISEEVSARLMDVIWSNIERLLEKTKADLLQELEKTTEKLISNKIIWARDIFRVPEVI